MPTTTEGRDRMRLPVLLLCALLAAGCASRQAREAAPEHAAATTAVGGDGFEAGAAAEAGVPAQTGEGATLEALRPPEQLDPFEPFNRRVYRFNSAFDQAVFRPVAETYVETVPAPLRHGVSNFFDNLQQPVSALNLLLQGEPRDAGATIGRFLFNLTAGVFGFFDPATAIGMERHYSDFGLTFAHWGWRDSRYLVLPLFGPSTLRDGTGKLIARRNSPLSHAADELGVGVHLFYAVDTRANALAVGAFLEGAEDEYLLMRDAFYQYRRCQFIDCRDEIPDYALPDYEFEMPDFRDN